MEKKSKDSIEGDNYLPRKYRDWKKEEKTKCEEKAEEEVKLPDELESMMNDIREEDINEIAGQWNSQKFFIHFAWTGKRGVAVKYNDTTLVRYNASEVLSGHT